MTASLRAALRYFPAIALCAWVCCLGATRSGTHALVSLDVHDAPLADVVAMLSTAAGTEIICDGTLQDRRVTIILRGTDAWQALRAIVAAEHLQLHRVGGIYIVADGDVANRSDGGTDPLGPQTAVLRLEHASPDETAKELLAALPVGTIVIPDARTRTLLVSGDRAALERARRLGAALDIPEAAPDRRIVTVRCRYLSADDAADAVRRVAPAGALVVHAAQGEVILAGSAAAVSEARSVLDALDVAQPQVTFEVQVADVEPVVEHTRSGIELGGSDAKGEPSPGSATYGFVGRSIQIFARLDALAESGHARILATPKVTTLSGKEADLLIGETYPVVSSSSAFGGQQVQYVDIGVKLRLTPVIGRDGSITADVHPEYSELMDVNPQGFPIIANRKIDATLRVRDGETIVLGGLTRAVDAETVARIPWLKNVPVVGSILADTSRRHERDEIVFLITPHIRYPRPAETQTRK